MCSIKGGGQKWNQTKLGFGLISCYYIWIQKGFATTLGKDVVVWSCLKVVAPNRSTSFQPRSSQKYVFSTCLLLHVYKCEKNAIASWTDLGWWHSTFGTTAWCVLIRQNKINCSSTIWCDLVSWHWWSLLHLKCYLKQSLENYRSDPDGKIWQWNWVLFWEEPNGSMNCQC